MAQLYTRDTQRSRVYAWERSLGHISGSSMTLDEADELISRLWYAERARYAVNGRKPAPTVRLKRGRSTGALAYIGGHEICIGSKQINPWLCAHETAHLLARRGDRHNARFVAILIGLAARHLGHDADVLVGSATEAGVRVDLRCLGPLPERSRVERLAALLPCTVMEAATEIDVSYRVVMGLALQLIRQNKARYWRGKLVGA